MERIFTQHSGWHPIVGSLATTNIERMRLIKQSEKDIFGTTEHGSAIQIRVERFNIHIHDFTEEISKRNPQSGQYEATDKGYLLFSLVEGGNKKANETIEEINQKDRYNTKTKQEKRRRSAGSSRPLRGAWIRNARARA